MAVTDARDGAMGSIASGARMMLLGGELVLAVPAAELPNTSPAYRITAFCSDEDQGRTEGSFWSGDLWPIVGDPLAAFEP